MNNVSHYLLNNNYIDLVYMLDVLKAKLIVWKMVSVNTPTATVALDTWNYLENIFVYGVYFSIQHIDFHFSSSKM